MKKGWRVILGIVLVAVVFGGLCCGVGVLTGADVGRIMMNLEEQYHVTTYVNSYNNYILQVLQHIKALFV